MQVEEVIVDGEPFYGVIMADDASLEDQQRAALVLLDHAEWMAAHGPTAMVRANYAEIAAAESPLMLAIDLDDSDPSGSTASRYLLTLVLMQARVLMY
ncbi:hypothetical protein [Microbacterium azadirachtae]|uniref:Uncharacterized protein n=1 Tax=Microbacterium azadirachtae TaxID=582680 RepID=A0A0F0LGV5_9MICO|nr:hypothetical protein [Microbacterium azadirachtae]KJL31899.1 hypothetical protein RS86_03180 [Microbacterium azadirachtae]